MKTRFRLAIATLALTAAAGLPLATDITAQPASDTTWGAPATTDDTRWDTQPTETDEPAITPMDTTWG